MTNLFRSIVLLFFFFILQIHSQNSNTYNKSLIKSNLEFLASDALKGREAGSEYEKIASEFIASEFKKYGVEPFGDNGTYFQHFKVNKTKINLETNLVLSSEDKTHLSKFMVLDDFLCEAQDFGAGFFNKPFDIVYCGYGITAPENDYDDYKDIDVNGKVVLVTFGIPSKKQYDFKEPEAMYRFYSPVIKGQVAFEHGAKAIIFLPNEMLLQQWEMIKRMTLAEKLNLQDYPESDFVKLPMIAMTPDASAKLLEGEISTFDELKEITSNGTAVKGFNLTKTISLNFSFEKNEGECRNVVGLVNGNGYPNEYVTVGAHYDHIGVEGGEICNGADDNGSGVTAVMEIARKIAEKKESERPVVFILYSGEEKGLLGSRYFADNFKNKDELVVNFNIDMCGRENADTLFCRGAAETSKEFESILKETDESFPGLDLVHLEGLTDEGSSSDHTSFARYGIPVVDFCDEMGEDFHQSTDDSDKIDFDKIGKTSLLIEKLIKKVTSLDHKLTRN